MKGKTQSEEHRRLKIEEEGEKADGKEVKES